MASVDVPLGISATTTVQPAAHDADDDPIEFRGAWCASVSAADAALAFAPVSCSVEREMSSDTEAIDDERETPELDSESLPIPSSVFK